LTHEIARLLRDIAYELIAIVVPGLVGLIGMLLVLLHHGYSLTWITQASKDQPWLFGLFAFAGTYAAGQTLQAMGHVFIYWLKLPWGVALVALNLLERLPGLSWLKQKQYFRLADVANDRKELDDFRKTQLFAESRAVLATLSGLPPDEIRGPTARDLAMAVLRQDCAERHKFLNLSELCLGMASAFFTIAAAVLFDALKHQHDHTLALVLLLAVGATFMLRQPRFFAISERVVFGQFLIKQRASEKAIATTMPSTHEGA